MMENSLLPILEYSLHTKPSWISVWTVFQSFLASCFPPQCRDGAFPAELWLGVSREAISVYKRGEPWPLEVFPYEQILSFGAPLPNAYKIAVEGRELVFETQMVGKRFPPTRFLGSAS